MGMMSTTPKTTTARRGLFAGVTVAALIAATPAGAATNSWKGDPTNLAGRSQMSRGELIYTDYLYDDFGPDLNGAPNNPPFRPSNQPGVSGDYTYPSGAQYAADAADLREMRLKLDSKGLHAQVALQSLVDASVPVATIAIDTDGSSATGAGVWPGSAGLTTPGADRFITLWGDGARWTTDAGGVALSHSVNLGQNTLDTVVPRRLVGSLSPKARVWVGVGLSAGDGLYQPVDPGHTSVYDLGFQGAETNNVVLQWSDARQAAALASGDLSGFAGAFDATASAKGSDRPFKLVPGYYNRIFHSKSDYGEGIDLRSGGLFGSPTPQFLGAYQPYGLYIPKGYKAQGLNPLLLDLHALNRNHNMYAGLGPDQFKQLGDARKSLIVTPLARGTDGWYLDAALRDTLEAWGDARTSFHADPDRTSIAGYSMGGYGTFRLGLLMPDRFARAVTFVGPQVFGGWNYPNPPVVLDGAWVIPSNTNLIAGNGLNLPYEMNVGDQDTLVAISGAVHQADTFRAEGNTYRLYRDPAASHFTFAAQDEWSHSASWLGNHKRVRNPVEVRYTRYPSMDVKGVGKFDGAYWVDDLVVRDASATDSHGTIEAVTKGLGKAPAKMVDEGPNSYTTPAGTPGTVTGQHPGKAPKRPKANAFTVALENLSGATLDVGRMGLSPSRSLSATLSGDGRTTLRLKARFPRGTMATLDGHAVPAKRAKKTLTLTLPLSPSPKPHRLTVTP